MRQVQFGGDTADSIAFLTFGIQLLFVENPENRPMDLGAGIQSRGDVIKSVE